MWLLRILQGATRVLQSSVAKAFAFVNGARHNLLLVQRTKFPPLRQQCQGRLGWQSYESIRERAQTFFTHQDLRSNLPTSSRNGSIPARGKAKDLLCREWNYTGKCSCAISDASYKAVHRCRVCDSPDHAMLTCAKRKYPIPASQSASSSTSSSTGADQSS